ncbi:hypothetical protein NM688_g3728 [Phlebia brevispora]|uniref:Uncharacterized protein n=1 Tax=Phlebia brevispora TaxID=194682 RepID=A0ACC1T4X7_9APHY|nr:hypothetical protein NM688_g3728 [Phlebia brevispora]
MHATVSEIAGIVGMRDWRVKRHSGLAPCEHQKAHVKICPDTDSTSRTCIIPDASPPVPWEARAAVEDLKSGQWNLCDIFPPLLSVASAVHNGTPGDVQRMHTATPTTVLPGNLWHNHHLIR